MRGAGELASTAPKRTRGADLPHKVPGKARSPLRIEEAKDVEKILWIFRRLRPRTFYATANVYRSLRLQEDLMNPSNIGHRQRARGLESHHGGGPGDTRLPRAKRHKAVDLRKMVWKGLPHLPLWRRPSGRLGAWRRGGVELALAAPKPPSWPRPRPPGHGPPSIKAMLDHGK